MFKFATYAHLFIHFILFCTHTVYIIYTGICFINFPEFGKIYKIYIYRKMYSIHFIYSIPRFLFYIIYLLIYFLLVAYLVLLNVSCSSLFVSLNLYSSSSLRLLFALSFLIIIDIFLAFLSKVILFGFGFGFVFVFGCPTFPRCTILVLC